MGLDLVWAWRARPGPPSGGLLYVAKRTLPGDICANCLPAAEGPGLARAT